MKKQIYFVTTNNGKFEEVKNWVNQINPKIDLKQASIEIREYQNLDVKEIAYGKAIEAWQYIKQPLIVDDGGIYIEKYNRFPGAFSKYVYEAIGLDGVWVLAKNNPKTYFYSCIAYCHDIDSVHYFSGKADGKLIEPNSIKSHKQLPYTSIFIPDGYDVTLAELRGTQEEKKIHHRYKAIVDWLKWLENENP